MCLYPINLILVNPIMTKRFVSILGLLALVALPGCHPQHEEKVEEKPRYAVTVPLLKDTRVPQKYVAQIHSMRRIELRSLENGYLEKVYVDEGQRVKKGQMMFKLKANVYQAELKKYEAEARAADIEYQNTKNLADSDIVSKTELAVAYAKLEKARAEVALAKTHLGFTDIRAPFNGLMDHLEAREGSLLEEGELLTTLSDTSKMWVYFNVSEAEYLNYASRAGKQVKNVSLEMANGELFKYPGVIQTIEAEFDNETGNIEMRATFPNPEGLLRHGETGTVIMQIPYTKALLIPQKATFEILDKKFVFVVDEHHKVSQREIGVAEELPHLYIVKSGLNPKDKVLLEGLRKVRDGQEIDVKNEDPATVYAHLDEVHAE